MIISCIMNITADIFFSFLRTRCINYGFVDVVVEAGVRKACIKGDNNRSYVSSNRSKYAKVLERYLNDLQ